MLIILILDLLAAGIYPSRQYSTDGEIWRGPGRSPDSRHWYKFSSEIPNRLLNSTAYPIRDHFIAEVNNTRIRSQNVKHLGFPDRIDLSIIAGNDRQPFRRDETARGVGPSVLFGHPLDHDSVSYQSLANYVNHFEEILSPIVYCRGSRFRKSYFQLDKETFRDLDSDCALACQSYLNELKEKNETLDIIEFVHQPFLVGCRVPIVGTWSARLLKSKFNNGPVGSVQFASSTFKQSLKNLRKVNLIDVLLKVSFTGQNMNYTYDPRSDRSDPSAWLKDNYYEIHTTPSGFTSNTFTKTASESTERKQLSIQNILGENRGAGQDNFNKSGKPYKFQSLVNGSRDTKYSSRNLTNYYSEPYPFFATNSAEVQGTEPSIQAPLKILAASSLEFGAYAMNNYKWPTNTGYFRDVLTIVEMPQPHEAIVDISNSLRRIYDSEHLELALLSSATLLNVDPLFVFHVALDWLYFVDPNSSCTDQMTARECAYYMCNWCGRVHKGTDWMQRGLAGYLNLQPFGSCGVPVDACVLKQGVPSRSYNV